MIPAMGQPTITAEQQWASYAGGEGDDVVLSMMVDAFGHVYVAGRTTDGLRLGNDTTGQSGLTHQDTYGGGASDAFLAKVAPQGSVLWCTYFGGMGDDEAVTIVADAMQGVYLVGHTTSEAGIATDTLSYQSMAGGGRDIFVAYFTEYGLLTGATYFGGPDDEIATGAVLDTLGQLFVSGHSNGPSSFAAEITPTLPWAAGTDGIVVRFHGTENLLGGTYIGGEGDDGLVGIVQQEGQHLVVAGHTSSATGIAAGVGSTSELQGGTDAFLVMLDSALAVVHGVYFGGADDDRATAVDAYGTKLAICGITYSDTIPADSTALQSVYGTNGDGFIAVYDGLFGLQWSTYVGDTAYDALMALKFDTQGNCYISGVTSSDSSMASATGAGANLYGAADAFLMRLEPDHTLAWSRYVGAFGEEEAHAMAVKGHTSILLGGRTSSTEDLAHLGHQMDHGGGTWDGFATRLDQSRSTPSDGICTGSGWSSNSGGSGNGNGNGNGVSPPLLQYDVCLGDPATFIIYGGALGYMSKWMWYADACGIPQNFLATGDTITIWPTESFTLYVRAEGFDHATACSDLPIVVHLPPEPTATVTDTICMGSPVQLLGSGAEHFTWTVGDTTVTGLETTAPAPGTPGSHVVQLAATSGACTVEMEFPLFVLPAPEAEWAVTHVSCHGANDGAIAMDSVNAAITTVEWHASGQQGPYLTGLAAGSFMVTITDTLGCIRTDTLVITMPGALMDSVLTEGALCGDPLGTAEVFSTSTSPGLVFDWGQGPDTTGSITALPPGMYTITATDDAGCAEVLHFLIDAIGLISVSVPADTVWAEDGATTLSSSIFPFDTPATYLWIPSTGLEDPTSPTTGCLVSDTTLFVIQVISHAGCTATDSVIVIPFMTVLPSVPDACGEAFLPDLFSPNGDGMNDELCLLGGCYASMALFIYDRWGQRVFMSTSPDDCWNGKWNGAMLPAGAYIYTLTAQRTTGEVVERTGMITLRR